MSFSDIKKIAKLYTNLSAVEDLQLDRLAKREPHAPAFVQVNTRI